MKDTLTLDTISKLVSEAIRLERLQAKGEGRLRWIVEFDSLGKPSAVQVTGSP